MGNAYRNGVQAPAGTVSGRALAYATNRDNTNRSVSQRNVWRQLLLPEVTREDLGVRLHVKFEDLCSDGRHVKRKALAIAPESFSKFAMRRTLLGPVNS